MKPEPISRQEMQEQFSAVYERLNRLETTLLNFAFIIEEHNTLMKAAHNISATGKPLKAVQDLTAEGS